MNAAGAIPLLVLAGSPGAGKSTLLARWLAEPDMADAGALLNEPAPVAIDVHLVGGHAGTTRALAGGCACCTRRDDLFDALDSLAGTQRGAARFERLVLELSGLADPAPLLAAFQGDERLRERFPLQGLATVVDALAGLQGLEEQRARSRAAAADVLVIAKTDLVPAADVDRLAAALARLNRDAQILHADDVAASAREVWHSAARAPGGDVRRVEAAVASGEEGHDGIDVHALELAAPVELSGFCLRLAGFLHAQAGRVLRVKGLVAVEGRRGPAVVQAVGTALHPVRSLRAWPAGAPRNTLVVMARGLAEEEIRAALP